MGGRDDEASAHPPVSLGAGRQCLRAVRSPALATKLGHETDVLAVSGPGGRCLNPCFNHGLLR